MSFRFPCLLYELKNEYGYAVLSLVYNGRKFEIGANDFQFISSKLNDMNEDGDGYCVEFSILKESDVVDAWNAEVRARGLSDIITQDELRRKVKDCYW